MLSISTFQKSEVKLNKKIENRDNFIVLSDKYNSLKKVWNKKGTKKKLEKIAKQSSIKNISFKNNNKVLTIKIKDENIKKIDKFINKILNDSFIINKLNITLTQTTIEIGR